MSSNFSIRAKICPEWDSNLEPLASMGSALPNELAERHATPLNIHSEQLFANDIYYVI